MRALNIQINIQKYAWIWIFNFLNIQFVKKYSKMSWIFMIFINIHDIQVGTIPRSLWQTRWWRLSRTTKVWKTCSRNQGFQRKWRRRRFEDYVSLLYLFMLQYLFFRYIFCFFYIILFHDFQICNFYMGMWGQVPGEVQGKEAAGRNSEEMVRGIEGAT